MSTQPPYLKKRVSRTIYAYNPAYGNDKLCGSCEHPYYRHFDPYEDWAAVGCKWCECGTFKPQKLECK